MSDRGPLYDQKDTPEDVATLYSWANLHGAKYRDFSESRAQTREKARQRVQLAIEGEQARLLQQAQVEPTADVLQMPEFSRVEEQDSQAHWAAEQAAQFAADQEATQQAAIRLETAEREAAILDAAGHATVSEEAELQVPRQAEIDEHQVRLVSLNLPERLRLGLGIRAHLECLVALDEMLERIPHHRVVIHDEYLCFPRHAY